MLNFLVLILRIVIVILILIMGYMILFDMACCSKDYKVRGTFNAHKDERTKDIEFIYVAEFLTIVFSALVAELR